jgi:hypothetical protein
MGVGVLRENHVAGAVFDLFQPVQRIIGVLDVGIVRVGDARPVAGWIVGILDGFVAQGGGGDPELLTGALDAAVGSVQKELT